MTLRTVFGEEPLASMRLASRSMSSGLIDATLRLPITGEMWTRCIDSQFCRYESRAPSIAIRSRKRSAAWSTVTISTTGSTGRRVASSAWISAEGLLSLRPGQPVGAALRR